MKQKSLKQRRCRKIFIFLWIYTIILLVDKILDKYYSSFENKKDDSL